MSMSMAVYTGPHGGHPLRRLVTAGAYRDRVFNRHQGARVRFSGPTLPMQLRMFARCGHIAGKPTRRCCIHGGAGTALSWRTYSTYAWSCFSVLFCAANDLAAAWRAFFVSASQRAMSSRIFTSSCACTQSRECLRADVKMASGYRSRPTCFSRIYFDRGTAPKHVRFSFVMNWSYSGSVSGTCSTRSSQMTEKEPVSSGWFRASRAHVEGLMTWLFCNLQQVCRR